MSARSMDAEFVGLVWEHYRKNGRTFAWRGADPYGVLLSEFMLQQTQTARVVVYYEKWRARFPGFRELAEADLADVLLSWQGLGYNRRAKNLHETAKIVWRDFAGHLPSLQEDLLKLPGLGAYTAGAVSCFAFNIPTVFIETNIRTVFLHHFFQAIEEVSDKEIFPLIKDNLDAKNPRDWYYALMDYGVHLKQSGFNAQRKSKHYVKQSKFEGSKRQVRSSLLKIILGSDSALDGKSLKEKLSRFEGLRYDFADTALEELVKEGLVSYRAGAYSKP